jgi:hypothetical protein
VPANVDVLIDSDLATVSKRLAQIAKELEKAVRRGKGWGVLREDIEQALGAIVPIRTKASPPRERELNPTLGRVLRAVDATRDASMGLSFVPKVVDLLKVDFDLAAAQGALLEAASRGLVELRPEGGLARLSDAELLACPEGPQGTRLSWARRIEVPS